MILGLATSDDIGVMAATALVMAGVFADLILNYMIYVVV
jgi:hypothetical protein